jgi:hypothetical protein
MELAYTMENDSGAASTLTNVNQLYLSFRSAPKMLGLRMPLPHRLPSDGNSLNRSKKSAAGLTSSAVCLRSHEVLERSGGDCVCCHSPAACWLAVDASPRLWRPGAGLASERTVPRASAAAAASGQMDRRVTHRTRTVSPRDMARRCGDSSGTTARRRLACQRLTDQTSRGRSGRRRTGHVSCYSAPQRSFGGRMTE